MGYFCVLTLNPNPSKIQLSLGINRNNKPSSVIMGYFGVLTLNPNSSKNGNFVFSLKRQKTKNNWIHQSGLKDDGNISKKGKVKQICLTFMAILYVIFGIIILLLTTKHINSSKEFCQSVDEELFIQNITLTTEQENILQANPELFYWNKCLYKTYPFTKESDVPCQCRVAVIDWNNLQTTADQRRNDLHLTQNQILSAMLTQWTMLEKFRTRNAECSKSECKFNFTESMFRSLHMKAFEFGSIAITSFETGISSWKQLEYLKISNTEDPFIESQFNEDFFNELASLNQLKYLSFINNGLNTLPESICNLKELMVLYLEYETNIESIPHCIGDLINLQALIVDLSIILMDVPFSIFKLPKLKLLSLFNAAISYQSILDYNLPIDINSNDTESVHKWLNDNFDYLNNTDYYLSLNPICDELMVPSKLFLLLNNTDACEYECSMRDDYFSAHFCSPWTLGLLVYFFYKMIKLNQYAQVMVIATMSVTILNVHLMQEIVHNYALPKN